MTGAVGKVPGLPAAKGASVARAGIEPATFHFSGERSYQLSYLAKNTAGSIE